MAVFGWICIVLFMLLLSASYALVAWNNLGAYNIGGIPNKTKTKALTIAGGVALIAVWIVVFWLKPFSVVVSFV